MNPQYFQALATTALTVSALVSVLVLVTRKYHGRYSADPSDGVQKLHTGPTPRIGGIAIYLGVLAAFTVARALGLQVASLLLVLLVAGLPVWVMGLLEDLTKRVSPRWRMLGAMGSALLAYQLTGVSLDKVDIPLVDAALVVLPVSIAFTVIAVAGVVNAVNLIDGMNGLASGFASVAFAALGAIAFAQGDYPLARMCVVMGAASLGFMLLNWPRGKLFLGDGGSYFLGFAIAWTCVQITQRHDAVSPFAALTICIHPVLEALYSIYRRWIKGHSYARADRLHLHSLVLRRVVCNPESTLNRVLRIVAGQDLSRRAAWVTNATTGLMLVGMSVPAAVMAYVARYQTHLLVLACLFFAVGYVTLYARLVRFRWCSPLHFVLARPADSIMVMRRRRADGLLG